MFQDRDFSFSDTSSTLEQWQSVVIEMIEHKNFNLIFLIDRKAGGRGDILDAGMSRVPFLHSKKNSINN